VVVLAYADASIEPTVAGVWAGASPCIIRMGRYMRIRSYRQLLHGSWINNVTSANGRGLLMSVLQEERTDGRRILFDTGRAPVHIECYPAYPMRGRLKYPAGSGLGVGVFTADTLPEHKALELRDVAARERITA
jgi:hypothetical protein